MAGGLLDSAIDKGGAGLAVTQRGSGQVDLSGDEIVYLTQAVQLGGLQSSGFADLLAALGPVSGSGPVVVAANDGSSSALYYLNDFQTGTIAGGNVRLLGLFADSVLQAGDLSYG